MDVSGDAHTAFVVTLGVPRDHFSKAQHKVARRYSEFEKLHEALGKAWGKQARCAPRTRARGAGVGAVCVGGAGTRPSDCHPLTPTARHTRAGRRSP